MYYFSNYYDVSNNKYGVKCRTSLRFWENRDGLMKQILLVGFRGTLGSGQVEHQKMIKDAGSKFDDYSVLPKIKQILLHWGYELTEKDFFIDLTN